MKTFVFERQFDRSANPLLARAESVRGDAWQRALERRQDCALLLASEDDGLLLLARLHWVPAKKSEAVEAPAGFLGLAGEPVYLDAVEPRKWWQKIFRS